MSIAREILGMFEFHRNASISIIARLKARTHREIRLKLSSKSNNSILVEWHHMPLSKVYGVPTEG